MQIAPGVRDSDGIALNLADPKSPDWARAIDILEGRICERFVEPVDFLIASEEPRLATERKFGFAVLAVDCLLVETLGAFIEGMEDTKGKSEETLCKFLTTRPKFSADFKTNDLAKKFYIEFRCGILHQAEVGGDSVIWSVGPLLTVVDGKIIVNRTKFHVHLKEEFQGYLAELRDPKNVILRENFRKKMDFISRS